MVSVSPLAASSSLKALKPETPRPDHLINRVSTSKDSPQSEVNTPTPFHADNANAMSATVTIDPLMDPNDRRGHGRIGMENGYTMSPMYALYLEYAREDEDEHSVSRRAAYLAASPNLDPEDIEEVEEGGEEAGRCSYRLRKNLLARVRRTMTEFQVFLERMAGLITERPKGRFFIIDPGEMIIRTLTRSQSIAQLQAGWLMLAQRMAAAQRFLAKYIQEYKGEEVPTSPLSTSASIREALEAETSPDNKLKMAYATFPRHSNRLSDADQLTLRKQGAWEDTRVVPIWLHSLPRQDADTESGEDRSITHEGSQHSRDTGPPQSRGREETPASLPRDSEEVEEIHTAGTKGKARAVSWRDNYEPLRREPLMGQGTPFKSSKRFFDSGGWKESQKQNTFLTIGQNKQAGMSSSTPNVLYGMGVPGTGGGSVFSSVSQFKPLKGKQKESRSEKGEVEGVPRRTDFEGGEQRTPLFPNSSYRNPGFTPIPLGAKEIEERYPMKHFSADRRESLTELREERSDHDLPQYEQSSRRSRTESERPSEDDRSNRGRSPSPPPPPRRYFPPDDPGDDGPPGGGGGNHPPPRRPGGNRPGMPRGNPPRRGPGDNPPPIGPGGGAPGGNQPPNGGAQSAVPYAYGNFVPTIKAELKQEQLPSWDGNHDTAIEYFWKVQQLAALGGYIPEALGYWLWHNLKEGSTIQLWFAMLAPQEQEFMRSHYLNYLRGIKEGFLGRTWQLKMNKLYENQSFRQFGHEFESPTKFIVRRIMFTRMLVQSDSGGPLEVFLVMQRAPISWGPVINIDSISNTSDLYAKVTEHEKTLVYSSRLEHSHLVTTENLAYTMRKLGLMVTPAQATSRREDPSRSRPVRRANLGEAEPEGQEDDKDDTNEGMEDSPPSTLEIDGDGSFKSAYEATKGRPRPPPKNGYPYPKNDHVYTKMGKLPPSPCKVCGSAKHWDKECPDWNTYLETRKRSANLVISTDEEDEAEQVYHYAYSILLDSRISSQWSKGPALPQDFHKAASELIAELEISNDRRRKSGASNDNGAGKMDWSEGRQDEGPDSAAGRSDKRAPRNDIDVTKGPEPPPIESDRTAFSATCLRS